MKHLTIIAAAMIAVAAHAHDVLIITVPEGDGTYGYSKPQSYQLAAGILYSQVYGYSRTPETWMGAFSGSYTSNVEHAYTVGTNTVTVPVGATYYVFSDFMRNIQKHHEADPQWVTRLIQGMQGNTNITDQSWTWVPNVVSGSGYLKSAGIHPIQTEGIE